MKKKILAVVLVLTLCFGMTGCTNVINIDETIKSPNSKFCDFEVVETNFYGAILVDKNTIITDLPYGQTSRNKWDSVIPFKPLWEQYERIIKDNGAIILFANGMFTADLMQSNRKLWKYNLIWEKTQPTGFLNAKKMPLRSHEDICIFYKKLPTYNPQKTTGHTRKVSKAEHKTNCKETTDYGEHGFTTYDSTERYPKSVWTFAKDIQKSALHPTQKPVALIEELIKTYTNPGDLILDSCAGSCTTAVAALNTGRNYICFEKDKDIFEVGSKRVAEYKGEINDRK